MSKQKKTSAPKPVKAVEIVDLSPDLEKPEGNPKGGSNVSKTRSEISMTFARNARA